MAGWRRQAAGDRPNRQHVIASEARQSAAFHRSAKCAERSKVLAPRAGGGGNPNWELSTDHRELTCLSLFPCGPGMHRPECPPVEHPG
jgi:hypothetical protein